MDRKSVGTEHALLITALPTRTTGWPDNSKDG